MLKFGKHKDWSTQQVYLIQELVQMMPVSQSLQAPLHLMAGPGQTLTMTSLAALVQVNHAEMMAAAAARDALSRSQSVGTDAALSSSLLNVVTSLLSGYASMGPLAALSQAQHQILGCQTIAGQLLATVRQLKMSTQEADILSQGVVEKLSTQSKLLSSSDGGGGGRCGGGGGAAAVGGGVGAGGAEDASEMGSRSGIASSPQVPLGLHNLGGVQFSMGAPPIPNTNFPSGFAGGVVPGMPDLAGTSGNAIVLDQAAAHAQQTVTSCCNEWRCVLLHNLQAILSASRRSYKIFKRSAQLRRSSYVLLLPLLLLLGS